MHLGMDSYINTVLKMAEIWSREIMRQSNHDMSYFEDDLLKAINDYLEVMRNPKIPAPPKLPDFKTKKYSDYPTKPTPSPLLHRYVDRYVEEDFGGAHGTYLTSLKNEESTVHLHVFDNSENIIIYISKLPGIPVAQAQNIALIASKQFPGKKIEYIYE